MLFFFILKQETLNARKNIKLHEHYSVRNEKYILVLTDQCAYII